VILPFGLAGDKSKRDWVGPDQKEIGIVLVAAWAARTAPSAAVAPAPKKSRGCTEKRDECAPLHLAPRTLGPCLVQRPTLAFCDRSAGWIWSTSR
jgi:hypothetical protein